MQRRRTQHRNSGGDFVELAALGEVLDRGVIKFSLTVHDLNNVLG